MKTPMLTGPLGAWHQNVNQSSVKRAECKFADGQDENVSEINRVGSGSRLNQDSEGGIERNCLIRQSLLADGSSGS